MAETIKSINPATLETLAEVTVADPYVVAEAVARAKAAQSAWRHKSYQERAAYLRAFRDGIRDHLDDLAQLISKENGKPLVEAISSDLMPIMELCTYFAKHTERILRQQRIWLGKWDLMGRSSYLDFYPLGTIGIEVGARTLHQLFRFRHQLIDEGLSDFFVHIQSFHGTANLSAIGKTTPDGRTSRHIHIRILEHDHGIFAAQFQHDWHQVFCTGGHDLLSSPYTARKDNLIHSGIDQCLTGPAVPIHHLDDTGRKPGLPGQLSDFLADERRIFGRL